MNIINQINNSLTITVDADIINTSSQEFDLEILKEVIIKQIKNVYDNQFGKYNLIISITINVLSKVNQCSPKKTLFQIVDELPGNNPAEADVKGLRVKLNKNYIHDFISNSNFRTLSHELGHMLGWEHPHANALFESVNPDASPLEKQLTETQRQCNLMSQTWYAQKAGVSLDKAMHLEEPQIELLLINYNTGVLNQNKHLKYFLWWKKLL